MRFIEPEAKGGGYAIVIISLLLIYFGFYVVGGIFLFLILPLWLFFCSSKIINPCLPNAITAPISGVIQTLETRENELIFKIKPRFNGRIYSPNDLQNIRITRTFGFFGLGFNAFTNLLNTHDNLSATSVLNGKNLDVEMRLVPYLFSFCRLKFSSNSSLFLEKIGFLNLGNLTLSVKGENLQSLAKQGDRIVGGSTALVIVTKD